MAMESQNNNDDQHDKSSKILTKTTTVAIREREWDSVPQSPKNSTAIYLGDSGSSGGYCL